MKVSINENGPVLVSLVVESRAEGCHWLKREIRLTAGLPNVEIINTLDKIAVTAKEGVHFGFNFNVPNPRNRMDIPWGVAEVDADFFPEANRNWICFQRWLDISSHDRGVVWCSPDAPLFQHGDITANIMGGGGLSSPPWIRRLEPSADGLFLGAQQPLVHQLPADPGRNAHFPLRHPAPQYSLRCRRRQSIRQGTVLPADRRPNREGG